MLGKIPISSRLFCDSYLNFNDHSGLRGTACGPPRSGVCSTSQISWPQAYSDEVRGAAGLWLSWICLVMPSTLVLFLPVFSFWKLKTARILANQSLLV